LHTWQPVNNGLGAILGKKQNAFLAIISVTVALTVGLATVQSTQASIDYWLQQPSTLTTGLNHITVYCQNGGGMDGDFFLTVKFTNATISTNTLMPYTIVDDSTVKLGKFTLHKEDSTQREVYFFTNQTEDVSISISFQSASLIEFIKSNALYPTQLNYDWNRELQVFNCTNPP
jgi:hypothetical protein